jgi:hypothetical protein
MTDNDPFLWLEDTDGPAALAWVREQNAQSLARLESDPRYSAFLAEARAIITAADSIPYPSFLGDDLVNFWQDEAHVRGLWRHTTLDSFRAEVTDQLVTGMIPSCARKRSSSRAACRPRGKPPDCTIEFVSLMPASNAASPRQPGS